MKPRVTQPSHLREFPKEIMTHSGLEYTYPPRDNHIPMVPVQKLFERDPSHALESRWAFYANTTRINQLFMAEGNLPRLKLLTSTMDWMSKSGFTQWDKRSAINTCTYFFRFTPMLFLVDPKDTDEYAIWDNEFFEFRFLSENADLDTQTGLCFRHDAPAPTVPLPDCRVTHLEMPPELVSAVEQGMKQAEEALIAQLGLLNPAITGMIV